MKQFLREQEDKYFVNNLKNVKSSAASYACKPLSYSRRRKQLKEDDYEVEFTILHVQKSVCHAKPVIKSVNDQEHLKARIANNEAQILREKKEKIKSENELNESRISSVKPTLSTYISKDCVKMPKSKVKAIESTVIEEYLKSKLMEKNNQSSGTAMCQKDMAE